MRTSLRLASAIASLLPLSTASALDLKDYSGKWELVIADSGTSFRSCSLNLKDPAGPKGELVFRWGSVWGFGPGEASLGEKGELVLKNGEWASPMTLRRVGNALEGSVTVKDGGSFHLIGWRAEDANAATAGGSASTKAVEGTTRREWGPPVKLLPESGLAGWEPREPGSKKFGWTCEGGVLTNSAGGDMDIVSKSKFQDFKLHVEYKVIARGNSGVYLRGRYEVQILDDHKKGVEPHGNGSVYSRIVPSANVTGPPETWQTYDITLVGRQLTVVLNGTTIIDKAQLDGITGGALDPFESRPGPLMLQGDHGKVWFRNIVVTPAVGES